MSLTPENRQRARLLLASAEACPFDEKAQYTARLMRELADETPDPFRDRIRDRLSEYALALMFGPSSEVSRLAREILLILASALAPEPESRQ
jgi:hypothetical protein